MPIELLPPKLDLILVSVGFEGIGSGGRGAKNSEVDGP